MPLLLILTLLFLLWFTFKLKQNSRIENHSSQDYWKREQEANFVRPQDMSDIQYIIIPVDSLPFQKAGEGSAAQAESLAEIERNIKKLAGKQIVNLGGLSNTDIKYKYGAKNYEFLAMCDQNYTLLLRYLSQWAAALYEAGSIQEAKTVLEYAVSIHSDVSKTYSLLAKIYADENEPGKISGLIQSAEELNTIMKDSILTNLRKYL